MRFVTPRVIIGALALFGFSYGLLPRASPKRASFKSKAHPMPFFRISYAKVGATPLYLSPSDLVENVPSAVSYASDAVSYALVQGASSMLVSTIDSDIASIPTDEFGKVFAGGVFLMFAGVFSALIVGLLLEYGNKYDQIAFDSYMQNEATKQDFLSSLSPEDRVRAEALLAKMEISTDKPGSGKDDGKLSKADTSSTTRKKEEMSLFSDYED